MTFLIAFMFVYKNRLHCINVEQNMSESLVYHTNRGAEFIVCHNKVYLTTDNIFVTSRNKIYEYIYISRKEPGEYMRFKQAPQRCTNLNWSSHLPILRKGSKLVTHFLLDVHGLNSYQRRSSRGPLSMKSSVVQWTAEAALQIDDITMVTSQRTAASHLGGVVSVWQHVVVYETAQALSSPEPALRIVDKSGLDSDRWIPHSRCCENPARAKALAGFSHHFSAGYTDLNPAPRGLSLYTMEIIQISDCL